MSLVIDIDFALELSVFVRNFSVKTRTLYNFSCPICGDSSSNTRKARGYLYEVGSGLNYKCHNCDVSTSLYKLLGHIDSALQRRYRLKTFRDKSFTNTYFDDEPLITGKLERKPTELDKLGLVRLSDDENNPAFAYAKNRKLPEYFFDDLWYVDDVKKLIPLNDAYEKRCPSGPRLVVPFRSWNGDLTGVTCRALDDNKLRYFTMNVDDRPLIYGLDRINETLPIWVFEGQFDSMFIPNSIAPAGTNTEKVIKLLQNKDLIFCFDNDSRNKEVVKQVIKVAKRGYKVVVWPNSWLYKDVNESIIDNNDVESIRDLLNNNTYYGLAADMAISRWRKD